MNKEIYYMKLKTANRKTMMKVMKYIINGYQSNAWKIKLLQKVNFFNRWNKILKTKKLYHKHILCLSIKWEHKCKKDLRHGTVMAKEQINFFLLSKFILNFKHFYFYSYGFAFQNNLYDSYHFKVRMNIDLDKKEKFTS